MLSADSIREKQRYEPLRVLRWILLIFGWTVIGAGFVGFVLWILPVFDDGFRDLWGLGVGLLVLTAVGGLIITCLIGLVIVASAYVISVLLDIEANTRSAKGHLAELARQLR